MIELSADTDPELIAAYYGEHGTLAEVVIPAPTSSEELQHIAERHAELDHGECVLDLVIAHGAAGPGVVDAVLELAPDSSQVVNTILTSNKAPPALLERLRNSPSPGIRDHVEMAMLERELSDASPEQFEAVFERYLDHESLGYAVRYRLAVHARAPVDLLRRISTFADATGRTASERLAQRLEPEPE